MTSKALIIAGFDPTGDAGVLADSWVLQKLGLQTQAIVTVQTVQNAHTFKATKKISKDLICQQMELLDDYHFVKIGMLYHGLFEYIKPKLSCQIKVCDPVLRPTAVNQAVNQNLCQDYCKYAQNLVFTPNAEELEQLTGKSGNLGAEFLLQQGAQGVVVTHSQQGLINVFDKSGQKTITFQPLKKDFHGGGCVFSTALGYFLWRKNTLIDSAKQAHQFTVKLLCDRE